MQLTSLLLLLSSGLGPKIQSGDGGGKSRKRDPGYFGVFPESKPSVPIRKSSVPILHPHPPSHLYLRVLKPRRVPHPPTTPKPFYWLFATIFF